jgi:hypothetical protein
VAFGYPSESDGARHPFDAEPRSRAAPTDTRRS